MEFPSNQPPAITLDWFTRSAIAVAPDVIGCTLVRQLADGQIFRGLIVESEAYTPDDPACHAYKRRTTRNEVMFGRAGVAYVYLIYGMYYCLNFVTDLEGAPSAVLLRALQLDVIPPWVDLTRETKPHRIAAGPGKLCRALKIDRSLNSEVLEPGRSLWLEHRTPQFQQQLDEGIITLTQTTRIGLTQGVDLPWRWYWTDSLAVSKR